ncbi:MAG TPA: VCBS repeat-containing protein, partial [Terriglobales bacterium]|nr:VCBS repeat-containing protein [Terriglobales bacterium]
MRARLTSACAALALLGGNAAAGQTLIVPQPHIELLDRLPAAMASADFNGDGHLDVVVSHFIETTLTVLLANGQG